ncbi:hypothetical protein GA0070609_3079 [Micromonospora echinaurantiaca]|uniref:HEAT repeat-containing protein n=1 Tax=Micromonospora echinaurantiaca TaxID=47857 RepID=A0A1C5IBW2_9ACTN|nr:hypothetical protein [Micromonospora echinaurantiaca]SCG55744.1 hypothetical protein GA0070609_3079 [Micromonospora echinaurantiaca]
MTASPRGSRPEPLAGLDSVDWAKFRPRNRRDAERDACEIPDLIRGLARAEGRAVHEWGEALKGALIHGHSGLYFRTVEPAAPFLIELCRSERPEVAAEALSILLSCIGDGPFHPEPLRPDDTELSEVETRTWAIIHAGRAAYYPWLRSSHWGARIGALELLGVLEPKAPEFQRELARLEASDGNVGIQQAIREIRLDL